MNKRQFERFYRRHLDKVYRYVFFRVKQNKELAEDLVSEIFIKALRSFNEFDCQKGDSAWIMTICKNHLANYWRDSRETLSLDEEVNDQNGTDADSGQRADRTMLGRARQLFNQQQNISQLSDLLNKLNDSDQEIVTLHYISGYNYAEVAKMKNLKTSAVKVAAHRAIKKLRKLYEF